MKTNNKQFYAFYNDYITSMNTTSTLKDAMLYTFNSNGKLFRPSLFWSMLKDLNIAENHFEVACGIEMIHTYSLVHDDLPAMDDDDYRRGRLTCHKVFGEDIAILTGDALLTHAFELIAMANISNSKKVAILTAFTTAAGAQGMIDGQVMDVKNENDPDLTIDMLENIHDKKTAMMIELPIKCAQIIAADTDKNCLRAARMLGLFYQIQDDYLDSYGDFDKLGKATNADINKITYASIYSKSELESIIESLSLDIKETFNNYPSTLNLIKSIVNREV